MLDFSKSPPETTREVVRESELYLQGQLTLATSADQRAASLAGIYAAAGAAVVAGIIGLLTSDGPGEWLPVILAGAVSALLFLLGAALCVWATLPVGFDLPGSQPQSWQSDVNNTVTLDDSLRQQVAHYQSKIDDNRETLRRNAAKFKWGAISGIAAPLVGLVVWLASAFCL